MVSPGTHLQIDRSFFASNGMHVMNYFASFRDFYGSGTRTGHRGNKITAFAQKAFQFQAEGLFEGMGFTS